MTLVKVALSVIALTHDGSWLCQTENVSRGQTMAGFDGTHPGCGHGSAFRWSGPSLLDNRLQSIQSFLAMLHIVSFNQEPWFGRLTFNGIPLHAILWGDLAKVCLNDRGASAGQSALVCGSADVLLAVCLESYIDAAAGGATPCVAWICGRRGRSAGSRVARGDWRRSTREALGVP